MDRRNRLENLVEFVVSNGFDSLESFSAIESFVTTGSVKDVCQSLLNDDQSLNEVLDKSFLHPAGIYKIVLMKEAYSDPEVRIHVWPNGNQFPVESNYDSVHNHRWNFSSAVLKGRFRKTIFQENDDAHWPYSYHFFRATAPGKLNSREDRGERYLTSTFSAILRPGTVYGLHNSTLHRIEPIDTEFSATLFIRQAYEADGTHVYLPKGSAVADASEKGGALEPISKSMITSFLNVLAGSE